MKATVEQIKAKIAELPTGVADLVHRASLGSAEVESFSGNGNGPYMVRIQPHKDDPGDKSLLDVSCSCPARTLCKHIVAFYAVDKGLAPDTVPEPPVEAEADPRGEGLKLIARAQEKFGEAVQDLVDGMALYVKTGES